MILSRFLQYAFIAIVVTTVAFSLYQWNASRAALKMNTNLNLNTNGLVGHWTLDGVDTVWTSSTAGTTLDKSGNANTGTLTNMNRATTPTLGKIGQGVLLDGTNDYVAFPPSTNTAFDTASRSASIWMKTTGAAGDRYAFSAGNGSPNRYYIGTNGLGLQSIVGDGSDMSSTVLSANEWYHVVLTYEGGVAKTYLNGVLDSQASVTLTGTGEVNIGSYMDGSGNFFSGSVDDVRVYNRALSATEIASLYTSGKAKENTSALQPQGIGNLNSGLTGYWKFDDGSGSTAADSSGNTNTGTLVNTPTWTTGQINGGIGLLNASAQYVSLGNPSTYDLTSTGQMTISAWVKSGSSILNTTLGIVKRGATNTVNAPDQYAITSSNTRWRFMAGNGTTYTEVFGPSGGLVANTWYHLTGVIDAANLSLYINGVSAATPVARPAGSPPVAVSTFIGAMMAGGNAWDGTIDEVRIYSRALSSDEISRLYRLTTPTGVDTSLKGYWSLDGNATNWTSSTTGTTADLSSYNNTGTLTNLNRATSPVIGKLGQGMFFTRSSVERVLLGTNEKPVLTNDYSIAFWVYPTKATTDNTDTPFVSNYNGYGGVATTITDNGFSLQFFGEPGDTAVTGPELSPNRWYFITGTRDSVTGVMNLYKDGVLAGTGTKSTGPLPSNLNGQWSFGQANNTGFGANSNGCGCRLDEIRMYDRVLSLSEITDLYQTGVKKINTTQNINMNGLVGHWTLDGKDTIWSSASAGTTLDTSGNSNTGTLTNMNRATTPIIGKLGQALNFDGVNDYVNVPYNASFDIDNTQSLSLSLWFKATSFPGVGVYSKLFGRNNIGNTGYQCFIAPTEQKVTCYVRDTLGHGDTQTANITLNEWHHLVYVVDGTGNGTGTIYLDNVATVNSNLNDANPFGGGGSFRLGYSDIGTAGYFTGSLDDFRAYNRVLSAAEITSLYNSGR